MGSHQGMQASRSGGYELVDILLILVMTGVRILAVFCRDCPELALASAGPVLPWRSPPWRVGRRKRQSGIS